MLKKFSSRIKYYSFAIFPILITIICVILHLCTKLFALNDNRVETLVSVSATFVGALLTVLTIYLAVPKSPKKIARFRESYHEHIYLSNVLAGIIIYIASMLSWIFFSWAPASAILFIAGLTNMIISIYYTFSLIKLM